MTLTAVAAGDAEWQASRGHLRILTELERRGPMDEDELAARLAGLVPVSRIPKLLGELARRGYIADTGRRSDTWRRGARLTVWRWVRAAR